MFLTYFVFLMATVTTSSGMASLGNGSIKKLSFRAKMAKYCSQNPSPCRFKMEVKKKQEQKEEEKFHNLDDNEIDREEEKLRVKARKVIANSHMQCHFTEKANIRIVHLAKNIKQKPVSDIAKDLKNLIQELLLQPQAIIICQPRDEELGDLLKTDNNNNKNDNIENTENARRNNDQDTRKNDANNVNELTRSTTAEEKLTNFESTKNNVNYSGDLYKSEIFTRPNSAENLPWKKENNAEKKTFKHTSPNHQSLPWKDELNDDTLNQSNNDFASLLKDTEAEINHEQQKQAENSVSTLLDHEDVQSAKLERLIKLLMKNANTQ